MQYQKTMKLNLKIFGDVHVDLYVNEIYISKLINCDKIIFINVGS